MACESWKAKLATYLDGELPDEETCAYDAHVRSCSSCSQDAFVSMQIKRLIQATGKRFNPTTGFRKRIRQSIVSKSPRRCRANLAKLFKTADP